MRSLNTRITFYSLALFVISLWTLALYTSTMLRDDMQRQLGEHQFSTVTIVAEEIGQELSERFFALKKIAATVSTQHLRQPATLQALLQDNPLFLERFNGGAFITDIHGTAIASLPLDVPRVGINFMERDHVSAALLHDEAGISEAAIGKVQHLPVVSMAAPIHDVNGKVVGALVGVITLSKDNFLDQVISHRYGERGGYLLIDAKHRKVVTDTEKRHVLQPLRPVGARPLNDRYVAGFQGFGIDTDLQGVEQLSAAYRVAASEWYVLALLPTDEAFAPIRSMQQRMFYAAAVLTLLAGGLIWWLLRRELSPLRSTATRLASLRDASDFPEALPITQHDEIGELIMGFNRMLENLRQRDAALAESEGRFRNLVEWTPLAIVVHVAGNIVYANPATVRILEADSESDIVGQPLLRFVHPDSHALAQAQMDKASTMGDSADQTEYTLITLKGNCVEVDGKGTAIQFKGKPVRQIAFSDVTEKNNAVRRLRQLSRITEQAPLAIVITKLSGEIEYVNPKFEEVTGFAFSELVGSNPRVLQSGQTPKAVYADLWRTLQSGNVWRGEFTNRRKNGELFVEQATLAPVTGPDGLVTHYVGLKADITLDKQRQHTLEVLMQAQKHMLDEKTALLNEVHHRVKNNMQVITSLLRLEGGRAPQPHTQAVLQDMQGRIRSMALVHETLYRTGSFAAVELNVYLQQVASNAFRAQVSNHGGVRLTLLLQSVRVGIDKATPCGLLANELVSNAIKHAFPPGQDGEIVVALHPVSPSHAGPGSPWCLRVSDNGNGLPGDFAARRNQSLGLQLVADLAKQLRGELQIRSENGAHFTLVFSI